MGFIAIPMNKELKNMDKKKTTSWTAHTPIGDIKLQVPYTEVKGHKLVHIDDVIKEELRILYKKQDKLNKYIQELEKG